jgi:hypothetical protein
MMNTDHLLFNCQATEGVTGSRNIMLDCGPHSASRNIWTLVAGAGLCSNAFHMWMTASMAESFDTNMERYASSKACKTSSEARGKSTTRFEN